MLSSLLTSLRLQPSNDTEVSRRRHMRRDTDRCVCELNGQAFPVENWSFGGVLMVTDDRVYSIGQHAHLNIKFRIRNTIMDVAIQGNVVRKMPGLVGIQFEPLNQNVRRSFQQVIDDAVAREFANSQA